MDRIDCLVIGAGVIGLACARALARAGLEVVIIERERSFGTGVSSRNSEVVHAGLYDAPGSLKATLCVRGRRLLTEFCSARGVPYRRCGKLVVATRQQDEPRLHAIRQRALTNGVDSLRPLTRRQALAMEPELDCAAALWSPESGILDSHRLMLALLGDAEAAGAVIAVDSQFIGATRHGDGWRIRSASGSSDAARRSPSADNAFELEATWLVNAAGLDAQRVAAGIDGFPPSCIPQRHLARGHYFALTGTSASRLPFSRLIYPTPVDGGLGIHLTLDLSGQARFGPDVEWLDSIAAARDLNYRVDPSRVVRFVEAVHQYWPRLPESALAPAYCGIRPKLTGPGEAAADFRIEGPAHHGCAGVVQLFGIESPGLTASLAIAERVAALTADFPSVQQSGVD